MNLFEWLRQFIETEDGKILFILTMIVSAMIIDFLTGTIAAKVNSNITFNSKAGINGILRKLASISIMVFFIPLSVLIPAGAGVALVYTLYIGYLVMELKSIAENLGKMGVDIETLKDIIDLLSKNKGGK
ncbi:Phage-related holin (Lysis protein) [Gemella morbillorum]|jgi:toxin secretion/phage lysis holin|uniref:phage holin family protein n=1 Tax=Gemella morbillorum TaxID=29391 RepID=UPI000DA3A746|nr:phage holin family protein [Gemella morbillorum]UBH81451.1 phage holin family protein [Gemella morbillorum]SQH55221.1 Phage-related holin (Lysis protein) [Gemella morbillorum]